MSDEMVPNTPHRHRQTLQQSWGCSLHTCLNTENAVPTCHILYFEPSSDLRDELGFILGVTLEGRQETLRQQAHHPASPLLSPPVPGGAPPPPPRPRPELRGRFLGPRKGPAAVRCDQLLTSAMVAGVDVTAVTVPTSKAAVPVSPHRPGRPGGRQGRAGGGGGRVTPEGGRRCRRPAQSNTAAQAWRWDQALNLAYHSLLYRAPPPYVPALWTHPRQPRI